ncbi:MAG: DUF3159 domain-containing protein [Austwickia sp.]|jgi:hypothetical protein|nr:DUF3159 domain-containing protein [Austwickia sp.]MBK8435540.1 DUF3159 domain-containing protein [Austwickia sp.]MBK9100888.1 DUF3159 domain-containing protein [Austwickia sp.]
MATETSTVEGIIRHRLSEVLGGWRGAAETAVPTIAFVVVWMLTHAVLAAVVASAVAVVLLAAVRLVQGQTVRYALSSVLTTVIAAALALRSGRAEDAFLPGILWNAALAAGGVVSIAVRWPVVGFMVAAGHPDAATDVSVYRTWRQVPGMVTVCQRLTAVLVVLFGVRLAIMLPLYLNAQVEWLGVAKIVLGWPAYLAAIAVMASILVAGHTPTIGGVDTDPPEGSGSPVA